MTRGAGDPRAGALGAGAALALVLGLAAAAGAWVPGFGKLGDAVAEANREAGRARPLALEVAVRFREESAPVATGTLLSDPSGRARLELRHEEGFLERHLLEAGRRRASRDGETLASPRPLLPPVYLLQAASPEALRRALRGLGADPDAIELGYVAEHDCYVLGGRGASPSGGRGARPAGGAAAPRSPPALWIDQESFEALRIQGEGGVRYRVGPAVELSGATLPAWIEVQSPGATPIRLEIRSARAAEPDPGSFGAAWLAGPASREAGARR